MGELGFEPADERRRKAPLTPEAPGFSRGAAHFLVNSSPTAEINRAAKTTAANL